MFKDILQRYSSEKAKLLGVVITSVIFILIRILMPIKYDGSFIDEYWHIASGISIFESGEYAYFNNDEKAYTRGLLMSIWVGSWITLFGKSILVAKLAPISIAIVNYFIFLYLTIKLVNKKRYQLLALVLYTFSPWIVFNHFYIRFYIVNELFLLVVLLLGYKLFSALKNENWNSVLLFLLLIIMINPISLIAIDDQSQFLIMLASCLILSGLFIYEFKTDFMVKHRLLNVISGNVLLSSRVYRAGIVLVIATTGFILIDAGSKIDFLLHGAITYTSKPEYKYSWLFWEKNGVITIFFLLAVTTFWWKSYGFERILLPVAGLLYMIHVLSSTELQIIRGILYFMPLYYLIAVIGVSKLFALLKLRVSTECIWSAAIISIFLVATASNYTRNFLWGPVITREINYIEYERAYNSVKENCRGNLIVEAAPSSPFIAKFYGVNIDYVLSTVENAGRDDAYLHDVDTGKISTVWGALPVITDINDLKSQNRDVCLIVRTASKQRYLPLKVENELDDVEKSWHFHNMELYIVEKSNRLALRK